MKFACVQKKKKNMKFAFRAYFFPNFVVLHISYSTK